MPFVSTAQERACYAKKAAGEAGSWDCGEWSRATKGKKLPKRKGKPTRNGSPHLVRVYGQGRVSHVLVPAGFRGEVVRTVTNADGGDNCGTGAGGFQPGNTCGHGEGSISQVTSKHTGQTIEVIKDPTTSQIKNWFHNSHVTAQMRGMVVDGHTYIWDDAELDFGHDYVARTLLGVNNVPWNDKFGIQQRDAGLVVLGWGHKEESHGVAEFAAKHGLTHNAAVRIGPLADTIHDQMDDVSKSDARETARIIKDATERGVTDYERVGREIAKRTDYGDEDRNRAKTVARTELTRGYAEGFLADLDDDAVVVFVANEDACQECADMDGDEYTVEDAKGVIPVHPSCSCAFELADDDRDEDDLAENANPEGCNQYTGPGCTGGGEGSYKTMADHVVGDPELAAAATHTGGKLMRPEEYPASYYRQFPKVYRGSKEGPAPGHHVFVTPDKELAQIHAGPAGKVEAFRVLPGAVVYPDPEVTEEVESNGHDVTGYKSLTVGRSAIVHTDHLGPVKHPGVTRNYSPDQPRDEAGRFTVVPGSLGSRDKEERARSRLRDREDREVERKRDREDRRHARRRERQDEALDARHEAELDAADAGVPAHLSGDDYDREADRRYDELKARHAVERADYDAAQAEADRGRDAWREAKHAREDAARQARRDWEDAAAAHHWEPLVYPHPGPHPDDRPTRNYSDDQPRDPDGKFAGLSADAESFHQTARYNANVGKKAFADLKPGKQARLVRSYAAQVLAAERSGKPHVGLELAHTAPHLFPGTSLISHAGAVEPYDGGRHEGKLAGHKGDVRVTRPGVSHGHGTVIRAKAEPIGGKE